MFFASNLSHREPSSRNQVNIITFDSASCHWHERLKTVPVKPACLQRKVYRNPPKQQILRYIAGILGRRHVPRDRSEPESGSRQRKSIMRNVLDSDFALQGESGLRLVPRQFPATTRKYVRSNRNESWPLPNRVVRERLTNKRQTKMVCGKRRQGLVLRPYGPRRFASYLLSVASTDASSPNRFGVLTDAPRMCVNK